MLQLLILCLCALQPVVLVLLGERRRHQQRQQRQQQHGIPGEHHASQAENTTGASRHFAFLFLISDFFVPSFSFSWCFFFFFSHLLLLFFHPISDAQGHYSIHPRQSRSHRASSVQTHHRPPPSFLPPTLLLSSLLFCSNPEDIGTSSPPLSPGDMDLWFHSIRICWWRVLFLMSIFQDYLSSMLDCPPTCSCSQTEIYCNKSDNGRFFPLLALQDTGSNGTSVDIAELFQNISSM